MIVLKILGILLLLLLGLLVLTGLTVLLLPIRLEVRKKPEEPIIKIRIRVAFFKIVRSFGGPKKKRKKSAKPKQKPKQKAKPKATKKPNKQREFHPEQLDLEATVGLLFDLMDDLAGSLTFEKLFVTLIVHRSDAGKTGETLGRLCEITGILYPELARRFVLKEHQIVLDADFEAEKTVWSMDVCVMTRTGRYPRILWRRRKALRKTWRDLTRPKRNDEEKEQPTIH